MEKNDLINGLFELFSGSLYVINIVRLIKDKQVKGVSWIPVMFFSLWGAWNLYYYPSLNQTFSFIGGISIFLTNITWLSLVFYYKARKKNGVRIVYIPLITYSVPSEATPVCDYTIQGFDNEADARDVYPDAVIIPVEFPARR